MAATNSSTSNTPLPVASDASSVSTPAYSSSSIVIKSTYLSSGSTLRRLTLKTAPPPTFADLEARLANLHRIPGPFVVTYKDADGDAVTIDTTRELLEVISGLKGTTLKVEVIDAKASDDDFELLHDEDPAPATAVQSDSEAPAATDALSHSQDLVLEASSKSVPSVLDTEQPLESPRAVSISDVSSISNASFASVEVVSMDSLLGPNSNAHIEDKTVAPVESDPFADPIAENAQVSKSNNIEETSNVQKKSWAELVKDHIPEAPVKVGISELCMESSQRWVYSSVDRRLVVEDSAPIVKEAAKETTAEEPAEPASNYLPNQGVNEVNEFIAKVTPYIEGLARCIEEKPYLLPELTRIVPQTLAGHNFGLILQEDSTSHTPQPTSSHRSHAHHHKNDHPSEYCSARQGPRGPGSRKSSAALSSHEASNFWSGVFCDGCDAQSFSGTRYKCDEVTCPDYDLCQVCFPKAALIHNPTHHFNEIKHSNQIHRYVRCDGCGRKSFPGNRFKCADCPNFDLCMRCIRVADEIHTPGHWFNRIDATPARRFRATPLIGEDVLQPRQSRTGLKPTLPDTSVLISSPTTASVSLSKIDITDLDPFAPQLTSVADGKKKIAVDEETVEDYGWKEVPARRGRGSPVVLTSSSSSTSYAPAHSVEAFVCSESAVGTSASPNSRSVDRRASLSSLAHTAVDQVAGGDPLRLLADMGFMDRVVNARLLQKYPGNVDKVIEILLRRAGHLGGEDDDEEFDIPWI
ncbi:hypothetical protein HDU67_008004 [Dinochytrium kinnereticum]|nr:hypothetical protein HDU67_008004 [Dinochytrium kinnereticum]